MWHRRTYIWFLNYDDDKGCVSKSLSRNSDFSIAWDKVLIGLKLNFMFLFKNSNWFKKKADLFNIGIKIAKRSLQNFFLTHWQTKNPRSKKFCYIELMENFWIKNLFAATRHTKTLQKSIFFEVKTRFF